MIHYFNPGHESAVLNASPYYQAPEIQLKMQQDLAYLPAWYANPNDLIFVSENLNNSFLSETVPFSLPTAITKEQLLQEKEIHHQTVILWGLTPAAIHFFNEINSRGLNLKIPRWNNEYQKLSGRQTALKCLQFICEQNSFIDPDLCPVFIDNLNSIEKRRAQSEQTLLAKSPYSSSGRGLLWLPDKIISQSAKQILSGMLKKQGEISLEKNRNKILDFSMQFIIEGNNNPEFRGYSIFETTEKGGYIGTVLKSQEKIQRQITSYIPEKHLIRIEESLSSFLKDKIQAFYQGCVGIDMMVYEEAGQMKLHPCVEINLRYNMGFLCLRLQQLYLHENSSGIFRIDFDPVAGRLFQKDKKSKEEFPLLLSQGKIQSGYLNLCPVQEDSKYRAFINCPEEE